MGCPGVLSMGLERDRQRRVHAMSSEVFLYRLQRTEMSDYSEMKIDLFHSLRLLLSDETE